MDKNINDSTPYLAGVIGHPISHSKSPKLHNYWLSKYNINGFYIPFSVTTEKLQSAIKSLIDLGFNGVNVTIPHKTNVATGSLCQSEKTVSLCITQEFYLENILHGAVNIKGSNYKTQETLTIQQVRGRYSPKTKIKPDKIKKRSSVCTIKL